MLVRFMLPSYAALGVCMLVVSAGNALGWPLRAMLMSAARLFVFYLPCLWIGTWLAGLTGLAAGAAWGICWPVWQPGDCCVVCFPVHVAWRRYHHSVLFCFCCFL